MMGEWKAGGSRDSYQSAKRASNLAVHLARNKAEKNVFKKVNPRPVKVYRKAKQRRRDNQNVIGGNSVRNDNG